MKITRRRLEEIIKEESHFHGHDSSGRPNFGGRDGAHEYSSIDKAMDRQGALKSAGAGLAEIEPAGTLHLKGNPSHEKIAQLRRKLKYGFEDWRK